MITYEIKAKIKEISQNTDNECCGFILEKNQLYPCVNQSLDPARHFLIHPLDYLTARHKGKIEYVYHSHTANPDFSPFDKLNLYNQNLRGLLYCKKTDSYSLFFPESYNSPYVGRGFEIGVSDCLTLVSDYYHKELGVKIPNVPRSAGWYQKNPNVVEESLMKNPDLFIRSDWEDAKKNDVLVFDLLMNKKPCHFAVYLGNDIILHHPRFKLSTIEILTATLKKKIAFILKPKQWN